MNTKPPPPTSTLPVPNSTTSFWRSTPHALDNHNTSPSLPSHADILIIGGGYAGISTAYHLLKSSTPSPSSPPTSIVLLEARQACSGATGRNGGHLRPDVANTAAVHAARHDARRAAQVARFELDHVGVLERLVADEAIDCDFERATSLDVYVADEQVSRMKQRYERVRAAPEFDDLLAGTDFYIGDEAPARTGVKGAKGYFASPAAHLWPYKLMMGLLSRALDMGLQLRTNTPVLSVEQDASSGGVHRITTASGAMTATQVVFATNAYTSALLPQYAAAVVPCKGLACHITSPGGASPLPRLPASSVVARTMSPAGVSGYDYIVQRADGSLVVGGAHQTYKPDLASWYGNADDGRLIDAARAHYEGWAARTLTGWEDSGARVEAAWTGVMGYSADSLPHVGAVPGRDGAFVLAGFNGHGMPVVYLAAKAVAEMVGQGKAFGDTGLPELYRSTKERLAPQCDDILR